MNLHFSSTDERKCNNTPAFIFIFECLVCIFVLAIVHVGIIEQDFNSGHNITSE